MTGGHNKLHLSSRAIANCINHSQCAGQLQSQDIHRRSGSSLGKITNLARPHLWPPTGASSSYIIRVQMSHFSLDLFRSCSRIFENSLLSSGLYANETQKLSGRSFARNARGPRAPSGYVQKFLSTAQVPVSKLRRLLNHDARLPALVGLVAPRENRDRVGMVEFTKWTSSPYKWCKWCTCACFPLHD